MRRPALVLSVLLLLAAPVLAHGEGPKTLRITDDDCVLSEPPCIVPDSGSSVEPGTTTTVRFTNELEAERDVMVHRDRDDAPGALLAGPTPVAPGATVTLTFDVPADATGVWYMASSDDGDVTLFGPAVADQHTEGEDSPGPGVLAMLGVVALAALLRRS